MVCCLNHVRVPCVHVDHRFYSLVFYFSLSLTQLSLSLCLFAEITAKRNLAAGKNITTCIFAWQNRLVDGWGNSFERLLTGFFFYGLPNRLSEKRC